MLQKWQFCTSWPNNSSGVSNLKLIWQSTCDWQWGHGISSVWGKCLTAFIRLKAKTTTTKNKQTNQNTAPPQCSSQKNAQNTTFCTQAQEILRIQKAKDSTLTPFFLRAASFRDGALLPPTAPWFSNWVGPVHACVPVLSFAGARTGCLSSHTHGQSGPVLGREGPHRRSFIIHTFCWTAGGTGCGEMHFEGMLCLV